MEKRVLPAVTRWTWRHLWGCPLLVMDPHISSWTPPWGRRGALAPAWRAGSCAPGQINTINNSSPLSTVQDKGLKKVLQIASSDPVTNCSAERQLQTKSSRFMTTKSRPKRFLLKKAECVALTGDHWTSVSNSNYVVVTAHTIIITDREWHLQSLVLTVQKTNTRHYAVNCPEQFISMAEAWGIEQKVTTSGTDCARTMMAAARQLPFQHVFCCSHFAENNHCLAWQLWV